MNDLVISTSPHIRSKITTRTIMLDVAISLLPCVVSAVVFFGAYSLAIMAISVATCVLTELIYAFIYRKAWKDFKKTAHHIFETFDFSSVVTGLILALILPTSYVVDGEVILLPWYLPLLGGVFAIALCKMLFGGTGRNLVNPACTARIFLFISFTVFMTSLVGNCLVAPLGESATDVLTGATPLTALLAGNKSLSPLDLFLGTGVDGMMGETCKLAILIGYIYLSVRGVIKWYYPLIYIGTTGVFAVAFSGFDFTCFLPSILSGGMLFGAVYMATDYVTSPKSTLGNVVYFAMLGLLTSGLRVATGIEVTSFAILIMNCITPLIDNYLPRRPFGYVRKGGAV